MVYGYSRYYYVYVLPLSLKKSLKKEFLFKNVFFENKQWDNMEISLLSAILFNQKICQSMNE